MTYAVVRNAPPPTVEQLGRAGFCCNHCGYEPPNEVKILPENLVECPDIILLGVGDALEGSWQKRQRLGTFAKSYDMLNNTKHELYKADDKVHCRRAK